MRKGIYPTILTVSGLVVAALVIASPSWPARTKPVPRPATDRPDEVVYWSYFHRIAILNDKADEIEKKGGRTSLRSAIKEQAKLSDEQARVLDQIALRCVKEVAKLDERADRIINRRYKK